MLVYGDQTRSVEPRAALAELDEQLIALGSYRGIARHSALVTAFIDASEIAQGLADTIAIDSRTPITDAMMRVLVAIAHAIDGRPLQVEIPQLRGLPDVIECKRAEGYAFYALYPELYLAAARATRRQSTRVIGIRSIGVGLAALVAVGTGAPLPATVRPRGNPYAREVSVGPDLVAEWVRDRAATFAIVDEGPGLSGSSFAAVADVLERHGVSRIEVYPSHVGELGHAASKRNRQRWARLPKRFASFEDVIVPELATWVSSLVGPVSHLIDISGGAWRAHRYKHEREWPPVFAQQERRKYLATTRDGTWLARFVGLGRDGERALARARALRAFTPEVAGLCHGFLVERWIDNADGLPSIERVAAYLKACAGRPAARGASDPELINMVRRNVTLWRDATAAEHIVSRFDPCKGHAVEIDGRLHAWEWRGSIKTDAHHVSHDLIGAQDIAWDVAGANVELGLDLDDLTRRVGADARCVAFLRPCYLAFQLGRASLAADASNPEEAVRLRHEVDRYGQLLERDYLR